jgi:tRNA pseudouridine13 synthase
MSANPLSVPFAASALPALTGRLGAELEDFQVTEVPAYVPCGEGPHCYLRIRKRGLTTFDAVGALARALGVSPRDVGTAGMKDKWAVTEQWVSVPGVSPAQAQALALPGIEVLEARSHGNKLRTGHLRGNRFQLRLVDVEPDAPERARALLAHLSSHGLFHAFGPQRFGRQGSTARSGRELLTGGRAPRDPRRRRLVVSALQAELFNDYLGRRLAIGPLAEPLAGEVCQKTDSGGVFVAEDLPEVRVRMLAGAVVPTGPLYGPRMTRPPEGTALRALEDEVLAAADLDLEAFTAWKQIAPGGRRPLLVRLSEVEVEPVERALLVRFFLPAGGYASLVLRELFRAESGTEDEAESQMTGG